MKEYPNPYNTGNRRYGGNISAVAWKTGQTQRAYDLSYDRMSRLTLAKYYETNANGRYSTQYTYDSMGNILTLKRNGLQDGGTYGLVDNLTYSYNGNQLMRVSDSVEDPSYVGAFNFKDGANTGSEYAYDANGNMTADKNKGISSITYNTINLPQKITFSDGKTTEYVYSYDGTKLQTKHTTPVPQTSTTTTYSGNMIYENGALKQMLVDGGYVTFIGATPVYHFYIQDHLGNNRVVAKADGTVEQINHYYPYGGLMADICTGSDIQPYKYNGKELDRMHGLDTYDYGARQHNAATGRWDRVDQLAEENPEVSPYVYCCGNPVNAIDIDGRDTINISNIDGKWIFGKPILAKGDDVFNVTANGSTRSFTFSEGEYGERVNALNLDITDKYTLGIYHISGVEDGGTGYFVTPGGNSSNIAGSGRRINDGEYPINAPNGSERWRKPGVGGSVAARGVRFHYDVANGFPRKSTEGCFVLSYNYDVKNGQIMYPNISDSKLASRNFDRFIGGSCHYNYIYKYMREGTVFYFPITSKLILKTR